MNYKFCAVLMAGLILTACSKKSVVEQVDLEKIEQCAFGKDLEKQKIACEQMNDIEKRIMACELPNGVSRKIACKELSEDELRFIPILDMARPAGTQFNFSIRNSSK